MDHYLATIQTILDRCENDNASPSINDMEIIKIGSKEVELEVVESSDASCEGCVFNNSKNYYCKDTHCIDVDRKDDIDVIYKEVKRS